MNLRTSTSLTLSLCIVSIATAAQDVGLPDTSPQDFAVGAMVQSTKAQASTRPQATAFGDVGGVNGMLAGMSAPSSGWGASAMGPMQMSRQQFDDPPGTFLKSLTSGGQSPQADRFRSFASQGINSMSGNRLGQNFWNATRPQSMIPQFNFSGFTGRSNSAGAGANFFTAFAAPLNSILSGRNPSGLNLAAQILASQYSPWRNASNTAFRNSAPSKSAALTADEESLEVWAKSLAATSNATSGRPAVLEARLQQIQDELARVYYTNDSLQSLRAEFYARQTRIAFSDPWYLYWFTELDRVLQRLYITRPSYNAYSSLAREVGAWVIPNDPGNAELARRYGRRRLLEQTHQQLSAEVDWALFQDRNLAAWINQVQRWLDARAAGWQNQLANRAWNADWDRRWSSAAQTAVARSSLTSMVSTLSRDFSTLDQTLRAAQAVEQSSAGLTSNAAVVRAVQAASNAEDALLQSGSVNARVTSLYSAYNTELLSALGPTSFALETERYWERMNGLLQNDTAYRNLQSLQFPAVVSLNAAKDRVYQEVAACIAQAGNFCDPTLRPGVRAVLSDPNLSGWITLGGAFTELHGWVQYRVTTSATAAQIDADTASRLTAAINQVQFRLQTARDRFNAGIAAMAELTRVNDLRQAAFTAMQQASPEFRARALEFQRLALSLQ